jgi:arginyl-tRNA synthetase
MNILVELRQRVDAALLDLVPDATERAALVDMVRPSQEAKFGDYQANCAMPLKKQLDRPSRDIAADIVARLNVTDLCETPEIAGPGFINLRLKDSWLIEQLQGAVTDERLGVSPVAKPRTFVIDYSAPNVAKPMHVGHIRSTVIGDSLYRTLKFLGHRVISDNHLGDWGTQFGMIIYGYRHFRDDSAYKQNPLNELARLYRLVNQLVGYFDNQAELPKRRQAVSRQETVLAELKSAATPPTDAKAATKAQKRAEADLKSAQEELKELEAKLASVATSPVLSKLVQEHPEISLAVLNETAKLHAGDAENLRLWREFMPPCLAAIEQIYGRLNVTFDHTLGESFYHDRLAAVVAELQEKGLARESEGALCVFLDDGGPPMIIRKKDGAFLYATTDLATIQYRMKEWSPDAILYVVDHRQGLHFEQLFAAARKWGYANVELQHTSFGTVLGDDGRPFKTRSGDTVGLSGLLDDAAARAHEIVSTNDDKKRDGPELSPAERLQVAEIVGIAAIKYADLSQNRTSDYTFSYDKMLAMTGNTATYMQYAYARVRSIFRKGGVAAESLRTGKINLLLDDPAERALGIEILRFSESLDMTVADYRPNQLTLYLFSLAERFATFYEKCPVLKPEVPPQVRDSRLLLCDLTARALKKGLELLGIQVVEKM